MQDHTHNVSFGFEQSETRYFYIEVSRNFSIPLFVTSS